MTRYQIGVLTGCFFALFSSGCGDSAAPGTGSDAGPSDVRVQTEDGSPTIKRDGGAQNTDTGASVGRDDGSSTSDGGSSTSDGGSSTSDGGSSATDGSVDPCVGKTCNAAPSAVCLDALQLQTYQAPGACSAGTCHYQQAVLTCPYGCQAGSCLGDPCAGKTCSTPPGNLCVDPLTLRSFNAQGSCAGGTCSYGANELTCPHGCANGACLGDPCLGKTCSTPPAAYCTDSTTLRSFGATGSCVGGSCSYTPQDVPCPHGCANGQCKSDPCAGISCTQPPQDGCIDASTLRSYGAVGQCSAGACQYSYVDTVCPGGCTGGQCQGPTCGSTTCGNPPASSCKNTTTLEAYAPIGACNGISCTYQRVEIDCSEGCFAGACLPQSYTVERPQQTFPVSTTEMTMAVDGSGNVHVVGCVNGGVAHMFRDNTGWVIETVDPGVGTRNCNVSLALTKAGTPVIAYQDSTNKDVRFARRTGTNSYAYSLVATQGDVGSGVGVIVDASDQVLVAYVDTTRQKTVVAQQVGGSWSAVDVGDAVYGTSLSIQLIFDVNGVLHLIAGDRVSHAVSSGNYNQPAGLYARRDASGHWTNAVLHQDAMLFRHSLATAPDGTTYAFYGVVKSVGSNDSLELLTIKSDGSTSAAQVGSVGNLLNWIRPVALFDAHSELKYINTDVSTRFLDTLEIWETYSYPTGFTSLGVTYVDDLVNGPDRRTRALVRNSNGWGILTFPVCQPQCTDKTCGGDGCGGSCGTCSGSDRCNPAGVCSTWRYETIGGYNALSLDVDQNGVHLLEYQGPYHHKDTSGNWTQATPSPRAQSGFVFDAHRTPNFTYIVTSSRRGNRVWFDSGSFMIDTLPFQDVYSGSIPIAFDSQDSIYALYSTYGTNSNFQSSATGILRLGTTDASGTQTTTEDIVNLMKGSGTGSSDPLDIKVDPQGHVHALWINKTAQQLRYITNASGSWVDQLVRSNTSSSLTHFFMPDGTPYVCWSSGPASAPESYLLRADGLSTPEQLPTGHYALDCTVGPNQQPAAVAGNTIMVKQANGNWNSETFPTYQNVNYVKLAFGPSGNPHVAYALYLGGYVLRYGTR